MDPHLILLALAHDLRSPVTVLQGAVERLDDVATQSDVRAMVPMLRHACAEVRAVIEDLLDAEKLRRGELGASRRPVDLEALVVDVVRHAGFESTVQVDVPSVEVDIDPAITRRILVNLLGNAARYSPPDGTIRVRGETDDDEVVLTVEDDGPGIADHDRSRVFDLFVRGEAIDDADHSGVGLYLVRHLSELHAGTVQLGEAPGGGAAISVRLPSGPPSGLTDAP